jgi:hypothetical protein
LVKLAGRLQVVNFHGDVDDAVHLVSFPRERFL